MTDIFFLHLYRWTTDILLIQILIYTDICIVDSRLIGFAVIYIIWYLGSLYILTVSFPLNFCRVINSIVVMKYAYVVQGRNEADIVLHKVLHRVSKMENGSKEMRE